MASVFPIVSPSARQFFSVWALVLAGTSLGCSAKSEDGAKGAKMVTGTYRGELETPGGPLGFHLEIRKSSDGFAATIRNGVERVSIPKVSQVGDTVTFAFPHYDSKIVAALAPDGKSLKGTFTKVKKGGEIQTLPFTATSKKGPRFLTAEQTPPNDDVQKKIASRYTVKFSETEDPAVGAFTIGDGGIASGTFLTTTGDYRYLAGNLIGDTLHLSVFDGSHAFLFILKPQGETLVGDFWSGDAWHETLVATPDPDAALPSAFSVTKLTATPVISDVPLIDLSGDKTTLLTVAPKGPRIIELFGSWCPNCHDAAEVLSALSESLGPKGLTVVGLAFEYSGEVARDTKQVQTYRDRHEITYPILLAGVADKEIAGALFPGIDKIRAFPTTLFVDHRGELAAVYTGFSGPATGEAYEATKRAFVREAERLVAAYDVAKANGEDVDRQGIAPLSDAGTDIDDSAKASTTHKALKAKAKAKRKKSKR